MNILIINQHTLNFGDDIAGISLLQNLLEIESVRKINIIYNTKGKLLLDNEKVFHNQEIMLKNIGYGNLIKYFLFRKLGWKKIKNNALKNMLEIINESDYIYVSPCGANLGIYKDWRFLIKLLIVVNEGKTPIFHLNTIGSSKSKIFDFFAKKVLNKSIIYVREKKSLEYIQSLGLSAQFGVDTAFSFKNTNETFEKKDKIAFIPTILKSWHPNFKEVNIDELIFEKILPVIAEFSNSKELIIELIPHLNNEEEKEYYGIIQKKLEELNATVVFRNDVDTVYKYNSSIRDARIVIGMRYHSIVLAIKNLVPFISLSYENKMQEVSDYSGKIDFAFKLYENKFNLELLKCKLEEAYINNEKISNELNEILNNKLIPLSQIPLEQLKR